MKKGIFLLMLVSVNGVASEVGASKLQSTSVTPNWVVVADAGAMDSWTTFSTTKNNDTFIHPKMGSGFGTQIEGLGEKLNKEIDAMVSEKLEHLISTKIAP